MRGDSERLAAPLSAEDQQVQSMPDASPVKWHLAHTSWFFETFLLTPFLSGYKPFAARYGYLFNSYYEAMGERHPRPARGLLTRPSQAEILQYRLHIDQAMERLLAGPITAEARTLTILGLAHEEQHQELILMDALNLFSLSPLKPTYSSDAPSPPVSSEPTKWIEFDPGVVSIGASPSVFAFDNETPSHKVFLAPFRIASRLVTNGEWLEFMADGGYRRSEFWLADGWARVQAEGWNAPQYWEDAGDTWRTMTLAGPCDVDLAAPVIHISFYEAAAFAAWTGKRLPTEAEWEFAALAAPHDLGQIDDGAWQWTSSAYTPYPGFRPAAGAVGEYNAKFMVGQMVLRGGACVTPIGHSRVTYRNFFYPHQRWMFSGIRLAEDAPDRSPADTFREDVVSGLSAPRKRLSPKWFYDARGSELFEQICRVPEYYLTRQENSLLVRIAEEIAAWIRPGSTLVELGSGASLKTRQLLDAAPQIVAYAPIDVSESALRNATAAIERDYPGLVVHAIPGDFTRIYELAPPPGDGPRVVFFPGSTIGNFAPEDAIALISGVRRFAGEEGILIIGVDQAKDESTLTAAYNDAAGITAEFNQNMLVRINRELGGDIDPTAFAHRAVWNAAESRIEMHLEVTRSHRASASGAIFNFIKGETIHTENSYKFTPAGFQALVERAGWRVVTVWLTDEPRFAVYLLKPD